VDRCDGCGFEYDLDGAAEASKAIRQGMGELVALVQGLPDAVVRRRPEPATWSPLEYLCHVRDVLLVQRERVLLARRAVRPSFEPMGRDERVEHDGYGAQEPFAVARQAEDAATLFANVLDRLDSPEWERTVIYNYPSPWERSLRWVAVHTVHEVRHHLLDVTTQLRT
jgi:hypothetical protein